MDKISVCLVSKQNHIRSENLKIEKKYIYIKAEF